MPATAYDPWDAKTNAPANVNTAINRFKYLGSADKVLAAIKNYTSLNPPSLALVERELAKIKRRHKMPRVPEPLPGDEFDHSPTARCHDSYTRMAGRAGREIAKNANPEFKEVQSVARAAALIPNKVRKPKKWKRPDHRTNEYSRDLVSRVCRELAIDEHQLYGRSRKPDLVRARSIVVMLLRERDPLLYSYPKCSRCVGRGDHSTAINLVGQFPNYCRADPVIWEVYKLLGGERGAP